jgi:superfamily II DNA or RNA helicase/transcriptional regulator with XRE-family HTH domain
MMYIPPDYGTRVRQLRRRYALTQNELATMLGVSFATVNRWENGQTRPSTLAWQKLLLVEGHGPDVLKEPGDLMVRDAPETSKSEPATVPDFTGKPEVVQVIAEGERLSFGHLSNPAFAAESSLIDPLPHQRLAVYQHMLPQPRLRFMLADDAGAGKTIMAGLYIREMLSRRLIRRVLIIPPAGLVGNWGREMRTLFNLPFRVVTGADARNGNPFSGDESDLLIVSVDTLAGDRAFGRLQEPGVLPYDLVIFDEAHKLAADREPDFRIRKTERYKLAEALVGISDGDERWRLSWRTQHLLLLTATPHMGKLFPYYCLWRLLEPDALATLEAFEAYPADARQRHFVRRTKEEMVRFDGTPIYPVRVSNTFSYDLNPNERELYDRTTSYLQTYYNRARILNRSAVRLAMSVFQRRLASSTYALICSFERRLAKLDDLIEAIRTGRISLEELQRRQAHLDMKEAKDVLELMTADEEEPENGQEENEQSQAMALGAVIITSLADLELERQQVADLLALARRVYAEGRESKFERLREVLKSPEYQGEKLIIFTEHRDTLKFLVSRLEALGFAGQVAQIHGGMDYQERDAQVAFFKKPVEEGGSAYLVATDAAGEGINLQFCRLMVNYDIPWNPARLEQRMGRIHRYGQKRDRVYIFNLVAGGRGEGKGTREGKVLYTLLTKLEEIRKELRSDKVFDVVGRLFEGLSLKTYMEKVVLGESTTEEEERFAGALTKEQVEALEAKERVLYGHGGDVLPHLAALREEMAKEDLCRLLPGYVRHYVAQVVPLLGIGIEGNLEERFRFKPLKPGALDPLWPLLEAYLPEQRENLTVYRPKPGEPPAIYLHPGEPVCERLRALVTDRYGREALRGATFVDPTATAPYLFHLATLTVIRQADERYAALNREESLECRLIGLRQEENGQIEVCPVEHLLLLKGLPASAGHTAALVAKAAKAVDEARAFALTHVAMPAAEEIRGRLQADLTERLEMLRRGYDLQEAELATARAKLSERARIGDSRAKAELARIKEQQRALGDRRDEAQAVLQREPELVVPGEVTFLAHALVVPSSDPEEMARHDAAVEEVAMRVAREYEVMVHGSTVHDVSTAPLARKRGLPEYPGFDLQAIRPGGESLAIEVKGRATIGPVELTANEWAKACNLRDQYWLYVVFECASPYPRLLRIQDPFGKLIARNKQSVVIDEKRLFEASELD